MPLSTLLHNVLPCQSLILGAWFIGDSLRILTLLIWFRRLVTRSLIGLINCFPLVETDTSSPCVVLYTLYSFHALWPPWLLFSIWKDLSLVFHALWPPWLLFSIWKDLSLISYGVIQILRDRFINVDGSICYLVEKGGLGFWSFANLSKALELKLWWHFHDQHSLWTSFMKFKFCRIKRLDMVNFVNLFLFGDVFVLFTASLSPMCWMINCWACSFWYNCWLDSCLLFLFNSSVASMVLDFFF